MTGIEIATAISGIRKDLPIILCTGYSKQIKRDMTSEGVIRELILKPLSKRDLARTARKILDG